MCQRIFRGWSDADTWNLDITVAQFILPRLIRFKELNNGYPHEMTSEEWDDILDDMIYAMEIYSDYDLPMELECDWERVERGSAYFGKYFRDLWW